TDYKFLKEHILLPAIQYSLERELITKNESLILKTAIENQVIQASDIKFIFKDKIPSELSRQIRKMIDKKMLQPLSENSRKYVIRFDNNFLLRGIIKSLQDNNFISINN
ncbi:MAG TPA: Fic family protein, partial [Spirochaetota bacterium]|nr:Fic family protein [Spirochaetota bacterium]